MKYVLLLCLIVLLSSCTLYTIKSEETSSEFYAPKESADQVQYIENVRQSNIVIGQAIVNAERRQSMDEILGKLKYEAAMIGGDAITNIQTNGGDGRWARIKPKEFFGNSNVRANFLADVIVFK
ncbi:MAG: hypothetical protein ABIJ41_07215 [Candidatus Omnitrophota bacterium]